MDEIALLRDKIEALTRRIEELETRERERDLEERSAFLSIVAKTEQRHGLKKKKESINWDAPWNREGDQ